MSRTKKEVSYPGVRQLKNGRYRAIVTHPDTGKNVSVATVLGMKGTTWDSAKDAHVAREQAWETLRAVDHNAMTISQFRQWWLEDPIFRVTMDGKIRRQESTMIHLKERTKSFAHAYGDVTLRSLDAMSPDSRGTVGDDIAAEWLRGGRNRTTVQQLGSMFNDARSKEGGRLLLHNPFLGLRFSKSRGRADMDPPSEQQMREMVRLAHELTPPSFANYLEFGGVTACRPGELDGLRWPAVDFDAEEVHIIEQWNVKVRKLTGPKYGKRTIAMVGRAREILEAQQGQDDEWVFATTMGGHYVPSTRNPHWNRVRCAAGLGDMALYLATRHYAGYFMLNVLKLPPFIIAREFGHKDGGELILKLYGHLDQRVARQQVRDAYQAWADRAAA